jgi:hypothetical protein
MLRTTQQGARRATHLAVTAVAAAVMIGLSACAPPPTGGSGSTTTTSTTSTTTTIPTISIPATTLAAPSFSASLPSVNVSYLGCGGTYNPPGITINGPSVNIPAQSLTVTGGVLPLPNVQATLAAASINVSSFRLSCFGISASTGVVFEYGAATASPVTTVDVVNGSVNVGSTTLTLSGRLRFPGLGNLSVNVPSFSVTVPGFSAPISLPAG